jgi:outer membrane protein assembly factor BamD
MARIYSIIGLVIVILAASCSKFEKIRKSPDYNYKFRKALEYYNKKDYDRASVLFDDVTESFRASTKADSVYYYLGMCNFNSGSSANYVTAAEYFQMCYQTNMYGVFAQEVEYMEAYSYYMASPRASLDQQYTIRSIELFGAFLKKHPESSYTENVKRYTEEMQDKLVDKSYKSAKLYFDMDMYKSSIVALKSSLDQYPNTKYREELMWMILESSYLLAENSVDSKKKERYQATLDEYYSYASEYPEGPHIKNAKKILEDSEKKLK